MSSIRVRPPHRHGRMLVFSGIAGLMCGLVFLMGGRNLVPSAIRLPPWGQIALTFSLPFFVTIYWGWFCQHKLPTFFGCIVFTASMMVFIFAVYAYFNLRNGKIIRLSEIAEMVCGTVVLSSVCGLVGLLVRSICASISRLVIQDGNLCPNCAYDIRGQIECRCPECGEAFPGHLLKGEPKQGGSPQGHP